MGVGPLNLFFYDEGWGWREVTKNKVLTVVFLGRQPLARPQGNLRELKRQYTSIFHIEAFVFFYTTCPCGAIKQIEQIYQIYYRFIGSPVPKAPSVSSDIIRIICSIWLITAKRYVLFHHPSNNIFEDCPAGELKVDVE